MFVECGGVQAVMSIINFYQGDQVNPEENEGDDYLDMELEGLITFALTSACFEPEDYNEYDSVGSRCFGKDYATFKPVMAYLQGVMIKGDFDFFEDDIADCLMGIDQILSCQEHTQAVKDFMAFPKIEILMKKIIQYYIENIR